MFVVVVVVVVEGVVTDTLVVRACSAPIHFVQTFCLSLALAPPPFLLSFFLSFFLYTILVVGTWMFCRHVVYSRRLFVSCVI